MALPIYNPIIIPVKMSVFCIVFYSPLVSHFFIIFLKKEAECEIFHLSVRIVL